MGNTAEKLTAVSHAFMKQIEDLFGNAVISVIRYGSSVTGDYVPGTSDINFLVVLTEEGISRISDVRPYLKRWKAKGVSLPLFLTDAYIRSSLDSYPVEFLNMRNSYRLIWGKDILAGLTIGKQDLRLQCEREVKGYLLRLRQEYIRSGGSRKLLKRLIAESLAAFAALLRAMLFIAGAEIPDKRHAVIEAACKTYSLDHGLFTRLAAAADPGSGKLPVDFDKLMEAYIREVTKLSRIIDTLKVQ
ncbi:hypothetical protein JXO52_11405 [bacterium]|nr:hypothetical protein [bacterium]